MMSNMWKKKNNTFTSLTPTPTVRSLCFFSDVVLAAKSLLADQVITAQRMEEPDSSQGEHINLDTL